MPDEIPTMEPILTTIDRLSMLAHDMHRIANSLAQIATAQDGLLAIAAEARHERQEIAAKLKKNLQAGFMQGKPNENNNPERP